ncbi:hypothetical protein GWK08_14000 [Leptobacterium flavescens]|uniref:Beta-lactamase-inhibitor-like PepSY-like domain-containing protein n=1 Tax=Leptobacterium flavescens TaxID=472055 RepID=A0A6P0UUR6_9FLAO|nr:hypothetical protein [Leptobacterium flavescens]NER14563.1 hypothetical protein [Leptobacterium flavescens]
MKKVFIVSAFMLGFATVSGVYADTAINDEIIYVQDGFVAIAGEELPDAVKKALAKDYPNAELVKAYVNKDKQYKLELSVEGEAKTVYANEKGEWIDVE